MKLIAITQRVDVYPERNERRDALDNRWHALLGTCDCLALPMPNNPAVAEQLWKRTACDGLIFSGGNDLLAYGGNTPERDETERCLLDLARQAGKPVLGVCRGMQFLLTHFGATMQHVDHHIATRHVLSDGREVNSYHAWGITHCPDTFEDLARATDGVVEKVKHLHEPIFGIMWHPERETPFSEEDRTLIKECFHR